MLFQYEFSRSNGPVLQTCGLVSHPTWLGWLFGVVLITPHAIMLVFTASYRCIFPHAISGMIILSKIQLWLYYWAKVWLWIGEVDLSRSFGWLTGGLGLHTGGKYTVFNRSWMFYYCLGSIHSIIDGYSYVTRLGWVFSRFFTDEQDCCCTAASD